MNIVEAIKSGRPFRRRGNDGWSRKLGGNDFLVCAYSGKRMENPSPDSIIADDWEIQEPTATITRSQFMEAFGKSFAEHTHCQMVLDTVLAEILASNLGLDK